MMEIYVLSHDIGENKNVFQPEKKIFFVVL